jgi:hypothetical protein
VLCLPHVPAVPTNAAGWLTTARLVPWPPSGEGVADRHLGHIEEPEGALAKH